VIRVPYGIKLAGGVVVLCTLALFEAFCPQYALDVSVTDCASGQTLPGVKAVLKTGGAHGRESQLMTGPDGRLRFYLDEKPDAQVTLTLERDGRRSSSRQFQGAPGGPVTVCLERADAR
jgi:hypothetical protein